VAGAENEVVDFEEYAQLYKAVVERANVALAALNSLQFYDFRRP